MIGGTMATMKKSFERLLTKEKSRDAKTHKDVYTEEDFAHLPKLMRDYFVDSGYVGRNKENLFAMKYLNAKMKMDKGSKWIKVEALHYLFAEPMSRLVYLKSKVLGFVPFEGIDSYLDGKGRMLGRLANQFTVFDETGEKMDNSALVTFLSEIVFCPLIAISDRVKWHDIGGKRVEASLQDGSTSVSGIFHFDTNGQLMKFTTNDRYEGKTSHPWTVVFEDFEVVKEIRYPSKARAIWNYESGDFEYFVAKLLVNKE